MNILSSALKEEPPYQRNGDKSVCHVLLSQYSYTHQAQLDIPHSQQYSLHPALSLTLINEG